MCDAVGIQTAGFFRSSEKRGVGVRCIDENEGCWGCAQMQCRQYEITAKREVTNRIDPAESVRSIRTWEKIGRCTGKKTVL